MAIITLRNDLHEALEENAALTTKSIDDLVNEAVEQYIRERQRTKLDIEIEAYEAIQSDLWAKYPNYWVAIHNKEVVDTDMDGTALYKRVREKYGRTSVLIRQITEKLVNEVHLRTPSTGKLPA